MQRFSMVSRVLAVLILASVLWPASAATILPAPDNPVAQVFDNRMQITWAPVVGATRYVIRRRAQNGYVVIGSAPSNVYFDTDWKVGDKVEYLVQAVNDKTGDDSPPKVVVVKESAPQTAPTGFSAVAGDGQVALKWNAQPGAIQYNVWRKSNDYPWIVIGSSTTTSYLDRDVINGVNYAYALQSRNKVGFGGNYASAAATPQTTFREISAAFAPRSVTGGQNATLTVSLDRAASGAGTMILLTSNNAAVEVPPQILIVADAKQITIPIRTRAVTVSTQVTVAAQYAGVYGSATLILNP